MHEKLVALIVNLVYCGLDVEQALTLAQSYARAHFVKASTFIPVFPREVERITRDAQANAEEAVAKAVPAAWIATEKLRKAEEPPRKYYTQDEVMAILQPLV